MIELKDIVKGGMRERFDQLRSMGIRTVMITGDNPLTAAAIAREAGVDDFLAQATPKDKMDLIRREQGEGKLVAMTGDGTNDAPALAQADVGVAMNTGTQAAKEAGNMVDLDSNPTKLIEVVEIGKQLLMTRGALTTFSIANDVAKYFAIIPAMFAGTFPVLNALNIMHLKNAAVGDVVGRDLQCVDHHRADPAGAARSEVSPHGRSRAVAAQSLDLRSRRHHRPVHWDQADRHAHHHGRLGVGKDTMKKNLITAISMTVVTTILLGVIYPLVVTGIAQVLFHDKANGQLISRNGEVIGSTHHRPAIHRRSVLSFATFSGGQRVRCRELRRIESRTDESASCSIASRPIPKLCMLRTQSAPVPVDLVTTSASGLDPDITPAGADFQVARVARERGTSEGNIRLLLRQSTNARQLGFLGEPRVNVLQLNLALDAAYPTAKGSRQ